MLSSWLQLPHCADHSRQAVIGAVRYSLNSLCCQLRKTGRKPMGKTKCLQLRNLHLPQLGDVVKLGSGERLPESIHKHRQCEHPVGVIKYFHPPTPLPPFLFHSYSMVLGFLQIQASVSACICRVMPVLKLFFFFFSLQS